MANGIGEQKMFGATLDDFKATLAQSGYRLHDLGDVITVSTSLQSDAQELIAHGKYEDARQALNRSKWVLMDFRLRGIPA